MGLFCKDTSKEIRKNSIQRREKDVLKRIQEILNDIKTRWHILLQDESIFIHNLYIKRKWISGEKRPIVTIPGSHNKTIVFGVLSNDGKQLFRQYNRFDSLSFIRYLEQLRKKFKKFVIFVDRAAQHRFKVVQECIKRNEENIRIEYFPVGSPEFNAVEECWRQGKYNILSNYYSSFSQLKQIISRYHRTIRLKLDVKKYLLRSTN
jgi:transposase